MWIEFETRHLLLVPLENTGIHALYIDTCILSTCNDSSYNSLISSITSKDLHIYVWFQNKAHNRWNVTRHIEWSCLVKPEMTASMTFILALYCGSSVYFFSPMILVIQKYILSPQIFRVKTCFYADFDEVF